jgi:hypothetical protein
VYIHNWEKTVITENTYRVKYRHKFPVDANGKLGGCYANNEAIARKELIRYGVLLKQDSKRSLYVVRDIELDREFVVPFKKVTVLGPLEAAY